MKLAKEHSEELQLTVSLSDATPAFVNAIRRYAVDYVPTLAIEDVEIVSNDSILYDEVLAHRLGLIPLKTDLKSYTLAKNGEEVSAMNSVVLTVKKDTPGYVYAKDMLTKDPKVKPVYGDIQITYLVENQGFEATLLAVMGQGKNHAKWCPGNIYYTYKPLITVNNKSSKLSDFLDKYPKQVVKDGKIDAKLITTQNLIDACDGVCEDIVKVEYDSSNFDLSIESFGQLEPKEILLEAINQFRLQLDEVSSLIKVLK